MERLCPRDADFCSIEPSFGGYGNEVGSRGPQNGPQNDPDGGGFGSTGLDARSLILHSFPPFFEPDMDVAGRAAGAGRQTFIEFPADLATGEAPPLFLVDAKGTEQLVNYRVKGRFYVVDRLFDAAELRLGMKHQQVVHIARTADAAATRRVS